MINFNSNFRPEYWLVVAVLTSCAKDVDYLLDSDDVATTDLTMTSSGLSTSTESTTVVVESDSESTSGEGTSTGTTTEDSSTGEIETEDDSGTHSTSEGTTGLTCDCSCSDLECIKECNLSSCRDIAHTLGCDPFGDGYFIKRANDTMNVNCDGEWTYFPVQRILSVNTQGAEQACDTFGLNLFYPTSEVHLESAMELAVELDSPNFDPTNNYLNLMAITPDYLTWPSWNSQDACQGTAFNSTECSKWVSHDDGPWWVSGEADPDEPSPVLDAGMHSMKYAFEESLSKLSFKTAGFPTTKKFFCTVYLGDDV